MLLARWLIALLLLGALVCFVMFAVTREQRYRVLGLRITKWTVFAGLAFFGVLIVERLVSMP